MTTVVEEKSKKRKADTTAVLMTELQHHLPVLPQELAVSSSVKPGLVIVDEVNGFCAVGGGNMAPREPNAQIARMVKNTDELARVFSRNGWPMLVLLDTHLKDKPEPPYPEHCIQGTKEAELVPELEWLARDPNATLLRKDCINGFIGGMRPVDDVKGRPEGFNVVTDWVAKKTVELMVVVGICTDICVLDFVVTVLSARNLGILRPLKTVAVYTEACATYGLPRSLADSLQLPASASHPQDVTHHVGFYVMKSRGAEVVNKLTFC